MPGLLCKLICRSISGFLFQKNIYQLSFSVFQDTGVKKRRLQYNRASLQIVLEATQRGVSIYRAARQYCVLETTLRDRACGRVEVGATIGFDKLFSKD